MLFMRHRELSTDQMVKNHANLVVTQWEPLSDGKKIRYQGSVL